MAFYQYTAEGHTLVRTLKSAREKTKVVTGEIIEIEDGVYEAGRLMLAGFEQIEDGAELLVDTIVEGAKDIVEAITGSDETTPAAPETPAVEVTTEVTDDGSKDITLEVTTDTKETAPESEESKTSDETTPATDEPKVDGSEGTDLGAESNASAPTGDEQSPESPAVTETPKITPTKKIK